MCQTLGKLGQQHHAAGGVVHGSAPCDSKAAIEFSRPMLSGKIGVWHVDEANASIKVSWP
jgi:hypothetical protein